MNVNVTLQMQGALTRIWLLTSTIHLLQSVIYLVSDAVIRGLFPVNASFLPLPGEEGVAERRNTVKIGTLTHMRCAVNDSALHRRVFDVPDQQSEMFDKSNINNGTSRQWKYMDIIYVSTQTEENRWA